MIHTLLITVTVMLLLLAVWVGVGQLWLNQGGQTDPDGDITGSTGTCGSCRGNCKKGDCQ